MVVGVYINGIMPNDSMGLWLTRTMLGRETLTWVSSVQAYDQMTRVQSD